MDTDRAQRKSVNAPGWRWVPKQGCYLWWDGQRYTARAVWDGSQWQVAVIDTDRQSRKPLSLAATLCIGAWFAVMTAYGILTMSAGGLLESGSGDECDLDQRFDPGLFFGLWAAGVAAGIIGLVVLARLFDARAAGGAIAGAAFLFPMLMLFGAAMNCSNY